jgi:hypothetical protein
MTDEEMERLERDPELSNAWRDALGDTPTTDWRALEARVTDAARFRMRSRRPAGWRRAASRWARVAIPAGLAASALLGAGLAFRAADESVALEDVAAMAVVDALPPDVASVGGESLVYALLAEGE